MAHPDEAVQPVEEIPSEAIAAAQLRHKQAEGDFATDQEKKQAAVEQAHSLGTRPDGSYAQLHEASDGATLAVADDSVKSKAQDELDDAEKVLKGEEAPAHQREAEARAEKRQSKAGSQQQTSSPVPGQQPRA